MADMTDERTEKSLEFIIQAVDGLITKDELIEKLETLHNAKFIADKVDDLFPDRIT